MMKAPLWLIVPPMTRRPASCSTGIDSPVTIDSSTALRPSSDLSIDRDLLARPHAQPVADHDAFEPDVRFSAVGADPARRLRREIEQRADRAARPLAGAQLQHLAEQHQRGDRRPPPR